MATSELYVASCVHIGAKESQLGVFEADLKLAKKRGARICLIGDLLDMGITVGTAHAGSVYEQEFNANEAIDRAVKLLSPYKSLIGLIEEGNHEGRLRKATSVEANWQIAKQLGIPSVYSATNRVLSLGGRKVFLAHGTGSADFNKLLAGHEGYDVIALGHTHTLSHQIVMRAAAERRRAVHLVRCGTYLKEPRYGRFELYPPNPIGAAWIKNTDGVISVELGVR